MTHPFIPSKLQLPTPSPGVVLRPRLFQQLNAGLPGKLTLISASIGFGQTTLSILLASAGGFHTLLNDCR